MTCRKCGTDTTRLTHDGPKPGKHMWYEWYFYRPACGWLFMPKEAMRHVDADIAVALPAETQTDSYRHQDARVGDTSASLSPVSAIAVSLTPPESGPSTTHDQARN